MVRDEDHIAARKKFDQDIFTFSNGKELHLHQITTTRLHYLRGQIKATYGAHRYFGLRDEWLDKIDAEIMRRKNGY
jgi:hypothetical protein